MMPVTFAWSQLNADPRRAEDMGSSACAGIAINMIKQCLDGAEVFWKGAQWASEVQWRDFVAAQVCAWDRRCLSKAEGAMGASPEELARHMFSGDMGSNDVEAGGGSW